MSEKNFKTTEVSNIFQKIPETLEQELFETILSNNNLKIKRIVSQGHTSPESGWYNQQQDEWVIVLQGGATLRFENKEDVQLTVGDHINIPALTKHQVSWTDPNIKTIWIAVFY